MLEKGILSAEKGKSLYVGFWQDVLDHFRTIDEDRSGIAFDISIKWLQLMSSTGSAGIERELM